jgi:hypothetical protein
MDVLIHHVGMLVIGCSVGHEGYCQDDYLDPIYQVEPDIKDTIGASRSAS